MSLFSSTPPVDLLLYVLLLIVFAAVASYALYRGLLRPCVEEGEWHPANLRRAMWCLFLALSIAAWLILLWSALSTLGKVLPLVMVLIFVLFLFFTRRRI